MSEPARFTAGQYVKYWGQAGSGKYYGATMTILYANVCGCTHQTYAVQATDAEGAVRIFEQVLEANLTLVEG